MNGSHIVKGQADLESPHAFGTHLCSCSQKPATSSHEQYRQLINQTSLASLISLSQSADEYGVDVNVSIIESSVDKPEFARTVT